MERFPRCWLLWGKSIGHRWIPLTEASDAESWYFPWSVPEQMVEQTIDTPVIWYAIALIMTSLQCQYLIPYKDEFTMMCIENT